MARWKLNGKHYLNVPGTEWEYEETTTMGKRHKQRMPVPLYLDPDEPEYRNRDGDIVVAYAGSEQRGDVVFVGLPTPDMEPLDDEAKALTAKVMKSWTHPIDSLPTAGTSLMPAPAVRRT